MVDLILQVLLGSTHCIEDLRTELLKIVFESYEVTFQCLVLILVCLEIDILLLGDFLSECNLLESILKLQSKLLILVFLVGNGFSTSFILRFIY